MDELFQQYMVPIVQWFFAIFTPGEWRAFVLLLGATIAVTQFVKFVWRLLPEFFPKLAAEGGILFGPIHNGSYLREVMWVLTCLICFALAPWIWPKESAWWVAGIIGGPAAAIAFKTVFYFLKKIAPEFASTLNVERRVAAGGAVENGNRKGDAP